MSPKNGISSPLSVLLHRTSRSPLFRGRTNWFEINHGFNLSLSLSPFLSISLPRVFVLVVERGSPIPGCIDVVIVSLRVGPSAGSISFAQQGAFPIDGEGILLAGFEAVGASGMERPGRVGSSLLLGRGSGSLGGRHWRNALSIGLGSTAARAFSAAPAPEWPQGHGSERSFTRRQN